MKRITILLSVVLVSIVSIWSSISLPLPDSVEAEVKNAINRRFDGIIFYEDKKGEKTHYTAG
jgi:hypothetical protein